MNKFLSSFKTSLFSLFFALISAAAWGQTTNATYTFIRAAGDIGNNISFTTEQNNGSSVPKITDGALRLLPQNPTASPYDGSSLTLTPLNGITITAIELNTQDGYIPRLKYSIASEGFNLSDCELTIIGVNTYKLSDINATSSIKIRNADETINRQTRLTGIKVTYIPGTAATYNVLYGGNSNTGGKVPSAQTAITIGTQITLANNNGKLVKTGFTLIGWNTLKNGDATTRHGFGTNCTIPANDMTIYAIKI